jgi:Domain of unknown function (DUF4166)
VSADIQALHFHSDHYFVALGAVRLRLPRWLEPGALTISHIERDDGWFAFILTLRPPLFGEIIRQTGCSESAWFEMARTSSVTNRMLTPFEFGLGGPFGPAVIG